MAFHGLIRRLLWLVSSHPSSPVAPGDGPRPDPAGAIIPRARQRWLELPVLERPAANWIDQDPRLFSPSDRAALFNVGLWPLPADLASWITRPVRAEKVVR